MILKINNYTFKGISIASRRTCIYVPELKISFDLGYIYEELASINTVLISHGHSDHIGCLAQHERLRAGNKVESSNYIMPSICIEPFRLMTSGLKSLDRGLDNPVLFTQTETYNAIPSENYQREGFKLNDHKKIKSLRTYHAIDSFGYIVYEERNKLKDQYKNLSGKEIAEKRKTENLFNKITIYDVAYTGDSTIDGILSHPEFLLAKILFIECTFFEDLSQTEAKSFKHTHIKDIEENIDKFQNDHIILFHFSARYREEEILERVNKLKEKTGRNIYAFF